MKPHPRIRKTIKWGGAAMTVLLVVVWIGSSVVDFQVRRDSKHGDVSITVQRGRVFVDWSTWVPYDLPSWAQSHASPTWHWNSGPVQRHCGLDWGVDRVSTRTPPAASDPAVSLLIERVAIPIWAPFLPIFVVTCFRWIPDLIARRRARLNLCLKCNYDRTDLAAGAVCPECGSLPA